MTLINFYIYLFFYPAVYMGFVNGMNEKHIFHLNLFLFLYGLSMQIIGTFFHYRLASYASPANHYTACRRLQVIER